MSRCLALCVFVALLTILALSPARAENVVFNYTAVGTYGDNGTLTGSFGWDTAAPNPYSYTYSTGFINGTLFQETVMGTS